MGSRFGLFPALLCLGAVMASLGGLISVSVFMPIMVCHNSGCQLEPLFYLFSLVPGSVCTLCVPRFLRAYSPRWRARSWAIIAAMVLLMLPMLFPLSWGATPGLVLRWTSAIGLLVVVPVSFRSAVMFLPQRRYSWSVAFYCTGLLAVHLLAPVYSSQTEGPEICRYLALVFWGREENDSGHYDYISFFPEAIPYTVARIGAGGRRARWYIAALRRLLEEPSRLGSMQRRELILGIRELRQIALEGGLEARAAASEALELLQQWHFPDPLIFPFRSWTELCHPVRSKNSSAGRMSTTAAVGEALRQHPDDRIRP